MYVNWQKVVWIPTSIFLIVLRHTLGQDVSNDYPSVNAVDSYAIDSEIAISCFTCHYHVQKGHVQGHLNCNDPFIDSGVPSITCIGPCGKIYQKLEGIDEFLITRNCIPQCKEQTSEDSFTRCCTDDNCNSASHLSIHSLCIATLVFVLYNIFS